MTNAKDGNDRLLLLVMKMKEALLDIDELRKLQRFQYKDDLPTLCCLVTEAKKKAEAMMNDDSTLSTMEEQRNEIKRLKSDFAAERTRIEPRLSSIGDVLYVMSICMGYIRAVVERRHLTDYFDETFAAYVALNSSRRVFEVLARRYGWELMSYDGELPYDGERA